MTGPSYAAVTPANMELSPCRVKFNDVDLGGTLGNVVVKPVYEKADIKADQFGSSVLDRRVKGLKVTVETQLAEVSLLDNWLVAFPHLRDTTVGSDRVLDFVSKIGESDLGLAKELLLHPLSREDGDTSHDLSFPLACSNAESEYMLGPEGQTVLKIVWNIYLDTSVTPARLARFGDKDVDVDDLVQVAATGTLSGAADLILTSVALGSSRNGKTFKVRVLAAAANPTSSVLAAFTGTPAAIILTITPNDGTNNTATPVSITETQLSELINTGAVSGKTITLTDVSSLRAKQTCTVDGSGSTSLADGGAIDGAVAVFSGGEG